MTGPVILVVGARPNFMKIAPIYNELKNRGINTNLPSNKDFYLEKIWKN